MPMRDALFIATSITATDIDKLHVEAVFHIKVL